MSLNNLQYCNSMKLAILNLSMYRITDIREWNIFSFSKNKWNVNSLSIICYATPEIWHYSHVHVPGYIIIIRQQ